MSVCILFLSVGVLEKKVNDHRYLFTKLTYLIWTDEASNILQHTLLLA